ncbi:MAG: protein kinase [Candidatus Melainabacteria bacterium]|nr:protein kinase [Candidatus Melainabacteria bacterium]
MKLCLICNFQTASDGQDICPRDGSSMVTVGEDPLLGLVVEGRYRIESVIGQGSAGTVYKAIQELIGREVAIKVLHDYLVSDEEFIKRFRQEAKASSRLSHPNIITIYDFGVLPKTGRPYIAMDLLRGTPLSEMIADRGYLPMEEGIPILAQVCSALGEAHRQGVVHRDVKPENIVLVERSGQKMFPIVVDFGIARLVQEESDVAKITRTGTVCGSPTYMSPEQCTSSKVDHRSDIYSVGIVIYETLTGTVPFMSDELAKVMAMHLTDPPAPINKVRPDLQFPEMLERVVARCLSKCPDDRYQDMDDLASAITEAAKQTDRPNNLAVSQPLPVLQPGPLATSEDFGGQAIRRTAEHDKDSREFISPKPNTKDLATRALEELQQRTSGEFSELSVKAIKTTAANQRQTAPQKYRSAPGIDFGQIMRIAVPVLVGVVLVAVALVYANGAMSSKVTPVRKPQTIADAENLIKNGKEEEALPIIDFIKKDSKGKLPKPQMDKINSLYLKVAKSYAGDERYSEAIALLNKIPPKTQDAKEIKKLLRQYRRSQQESVKKK